jgi:hypothetical protein
MCAILRGWRQEMEGSASYVVAAAIGIVSGHNDPRVKPGARHYAGIFLEVS